MNKHTVKEFNAACRLLGLTDQERADLAPSGFSKLKRTKSIEAHPDKHKQSETEQTAATSRIQEINAALDIIEDCLEDSSFNQDAQEEESEAILEEFVTPWQKEQYDEVTKKLLTPDLSLTSLISVLNALVDTHKGTKELTALVTSLVTNKRIPPDRFYNLLLQAAPEVIKAYFDAVNTSAEALTALFDTLKQNVAAYGLVAQSGHDALFFASNIAYTDTLKGLAMLGSLLPEGSAESLKCKDAMISIVTTHETWAKKQTFFTDNATTMRLLPAGQIAELAIGSPYLGPKNKIENEHSFQKLETKYAEFIAAQAEVMVTTSSMTSTTAAAVVASSSATPTTQVDPSALQMTVYNPEFAKYQLSKSTITSTAVSSAPIIATASSSVSTAPLAVTASPQPFSHHALAAQLHKAVFTRKAALTATLKTDAKSNDADTRTKAQDLLRFMNALDKKYDAITYTQNPERLLALVEMAEKISDSQSTPTVLANIKQIPAYQLARQQAIVSRQINFINHTDRTGLQPAQTKELDKILAQREYVRAELAGINRLITGSPATIDIERTGEYRAISQRVSALSYYANTVMVSETKTLRSHATFGALHTNLLNTSAALVTTLANSQPIVAAATGAETLRQAAALEAAKTTSIGASAPTQYTDLFDATHATKIPATLLPQLQALFENQTATSVSELFTDFHNSTAAKSLFQLELFEHLVDFMAGRIDHHALDEKLNNLPARYPNHQHQERLFNTLALTISQDALAKEGLFGNVWATIKNAARRAFRVTPIPEAEKKAKSFWQLPWFASAYTPNALQSERTNYNQALKKLTALEVTIATSGIQLLKLSSRKEEMQQINVQLTLAKKELVNMAEPIDALKERLNKQLPYLALVEKFQTNFNALQKLAKAETVDAATAQTLIDEHIAIAKEFQAQGFTDNMAQFYSLGDHVMSGDAASSTPMITLQTTLEQITTKGFTHPSITQHIYDLRQTSSLYKNTQDLSHLATGIDSATQVYQNSQTLFEVLRRLGPDSAEAELGESIQTLLTSITEGSEAEKEHQDQLDQIAHHIEQDLETFYETITQYKTEHKQTLPTASENTYTQTYCRMASRRNLPQAVAALASVTANNRISFDALVVTQRANLAALKDDANPPVWLSELIQATDFGDTFDKLIATIHCDETLTAALGGDINPTITQLNTHIATHMANTAIQNQQDPRQAIETLTRHFNELIKVLIIGTTQTNAQAAPEAEHIITSLLPAQLQNSLDSNPQLKENMSAQIRINYRLSNTAPIDNALIVDFIVLNTIQNAERNPTLLGATGVTKPVFLDSHKGQLEQRLNTATAALRIDHPETRLRSSSSTAFTTLSALEIQREKEKQTAITASQAKKGIPDTQNVPDQLKTGGAAASTTTSLTSTGQPVHPAGLKN